MAAGAGNGAVGGKNRIVKQHAAQLDDRFVQLISAEIVLRLRPAFRQMKLVAAALEE